MRKNLVCLVTVLCLMVLLAGCGAKTETGSSGSGDRAGTVVEADDSAVEPGTEAEADKPAAEPAADGSGDGAGTEAEADELTSSAGADTGKADESAGSRKEDTAKPGRLLYMGHASIRITTPEDKVIYIDPFAGEGYEPAADLILSTHDHYDHNAMDLIAGRNEGCRLITRKEALADGEHQTFDLGFATVEAVEAGNNQYHSIDECVGYIITLTDGVSVYVTGDTSTTQQMAELADRKIDYAFFCCDGVYNMDLDEAAECAKMVKAQHNIPYHMISADSGKFFDQSRAEQFEAPDRMILEDGQEIDLK
ncbi:MAG: MBL fold metallo-hydrolase [Eubacteriales bacterium]|nr:MBL fold metallo-hydrolase [Eubacteriales bacterium]